MNALTERYRIRTALRFALHESRISYADNDPLGLNAVILGDAVEAVESGLGFELRVPLDPHEDQSMTLERLVKSFRRHGLGVTVQVLAEFGPDGEELVVLELVVYATQAVAGFQGEVSADVR
jgi:hypothetical protein